MGGVERRSDGGAAELPVGSPRVALNGHVRAPQDDSGLLTQIDETLWLGGYTPGVTLPAVIQHVVALSWRLQSRHLGERLPAPRPHACPLHRRGEPFRPDRRRRAHSGGDGRRACDRAAPGQAGPRCALQSELRAVASHRRRAQPAAALTSAAVRTRRAGTAALRGAGRALGAWQSTPDPARGRRRRRGGCAGRRPGTNSWARPACSPAGSRPRGAA